MVPVTICKNYKLLALPTTEDQLNKNRPFRMLGQLLNMTLQEEEVTQKSCSLGNDSFKDSWIFSLWGLLIFFLRNLWVSEMIYLERSCRNDLFYLLKRVNVIVDTSGHTRSLPFP